jgi:hypothetical protein
MAFPCQNPIFLAFQCAMRPFDRPARPPILPVVPILSVSRTSRTSGNGIRLYSPWRGLSNRIFGLFSTRMVGHVISERVRSSP